MKQHIDTTQLSQLTDKGMERLQHWFLENKQEYIDQKKKDIKSSTTATEMFIHHDLLMDDLESLQFSDAYLLSIGKMIEFLGDNDINVQISDTKNSLISLKDNARWLAHDATIVESLGKLWTDGGTGELCDALWIACVEILNRE